MTAPATWPYSTHDEVSHLACEDVAVLRARIDQLLEERRQSRVELGLGEVHLPPEWRLTATEHRFVACLVQTPSHGCATKEKLHAALSGKDEPDTELKIVDVIVCKVRKKLAPFFPGGEPIETVWGRGYKLSAAARDALRA